MMVPLVTYHKRQLEALVDSSAQSQSTSHWIPVASIVSDPSPFVIWFFKGRFDTYYVYIYIYW